MIGTISKEFCCYTLVGGAAFAVDFSLFAGLTNVLGMHYLFATVCAFILGTWVNYWLSVHWVFSFRAIHTRSTEFAAFLLVGVLTLGLSLLLIASLVEGMGLHVLLAKCITAACTLVANYAGRRFLLFSRRDHTLATTSLR